MGIRQIKGWAALAVLLGLTVPSARADWLAITPDSISNPPAASRYGIFAPVPSGGLVTGQYTGVGLYFPTSTDGSTTALTTEYGAKAWVPAVLQTQPASLGGVQAVMTPGGWAGARFVTPGTMTPTTVSSAAVELVGSPGIVDFSNSHGQLLGTGKLSGTGPHGGFLYTFTESGIQSFSIPYFTPAESGGYPSWGPTGGVAEISFTTAQAPEPSSLLLAGVGALGVVARVGWRRSSGRIACDFA